MRKAKVQKDNKNCRVHLLLEEDVVSTDAAIKPIASVAIASVPIQKDIQDADRYESL
jgi:hypothetical protein